MDKNVWLLEAPQGVLERVPATEDQQRDHCSGRISTLPCSEIHFAIGRNTFCKILLIIWGNTLVLQPHPILHKFNVWMFSLWFYFSKKQMNTIKKFSGVERKFLTTVASE